MIRRYGGPGMCGVGGIPLANMGVSIGQVAAAPWYDPNNEGLCVWAAYQPCGAASFAASLVDLSGNGNNAIDPGGASTPGWGAANGWTFNGAGNYLTTAFVPQNDQSQSILVQFTNVTNDGYLAGALNTAVRAFMIRPNFTATSVLYYNGGNAAMAPPLLAGNLGIAGNQGYRNGTANGGAIPAWGGASGFAAYIGIASNSALFIAANIQAIAFYSCTLTGLQMAAVAAAMASL